MRSPCPLDRASAFTVQLIPCSDRWCTYTRCVRVRTTPKPNKHYLTQFLGGMKHNVCAARENADPAVLCRARCPRDWVSMCQMSANRINRKWYTRRDRRIKLPDCEQVTERIGRAIGVSVCMFMYNIVSNIDRFNCYKCANYARTPSSQRRVSACACSARNSVTNLRLR